MRLKLVAAACILGVAFLVAGAGVCDEKVSMSEWTQIIEQIGNKGSINWTGGYVEAVGIGAPPDQSIGKPNARPMALRAAQVDAYRNLLETVNGVRIDAATTVKDFTTQSDVINTQVQGIVKGAKTMKQEYMSDGTVEVTVRMPLSGDFSQVIVPRILDKKQIVPPAPEVAPPAGPAAVVYTGLVVDARGLQARPAMSPKILDENGKEVYGSMNVDREYAVQQGMSGYARDLTAAQSNSRVTNNPVTVKGLKADGQGRSDIVISNAAATAIKSAADNLTFMKKCRVMIVLD
ncbi:MAG: LPP20 family lipoprotein [Deltaproteobacteria bacterium]|nr:LPP20 family lipoprotein [Deltaproteobacteria bacterium]